MDEEQAGAAGAAQETGSALAELAQALLPVESLDEALPHLRRPFAPEAVKFKVQAVWPKEGQPRGCMVVAYIDARLVIERLNAVCGGSWFPTYRQATVETFLWCDLTVFGVTRPDVGESYKKLSKDLVSDALKRAGVPFGVGVSVYALPQITLYANQPHVEVKDVWDAKAKKKKPTLALTELGHTKLREGYAGWLAKHGERLFGPALDHGDVEGQTIDPDEGEPDGAEQAPDAPEPLKDDEAVRLRGEIEQAFRVLRAASKTRLLPAAFQQELLAAQGSHEDLRGLLTRLQDMVGEETARAAA